MGRPENYEWTEEKIAILKKYYPIRDYKNLFKELEYDDIDCIRHKAMRLEIAVIGYHYTKDEIKFIKDNYEKMSYKEIGDILNKSDSGVATQVKNLGLIKIAKWTEEELNLLKEKYPYYSNEYLSRNILPNRNKESINLMASKLKLKKAKEQNNKVYDKEEILAMLLDLSKKLNRTPLIEELTINGLPSDTTYRRRFGGYKNACRLAGLEPNYDLWGRAKVFYSSNGDICFSNAELIITEFLITNKISYEKDKMYCDIVDDFRCGTKRVDWFLNDGSIAEYWGYPKVEDYKPSMELKIQICKDNKINLIEINRKDLTKLHNIFSQYI